MADIGIGNKMIECEHRGEECIEDCVCCPNNADCAPNNGYTTLPDIMEIVRGHGGVSKIRRNGIVWYKIDVDERGLGIVVSANELIQSQSRFKELCFEEFGFVVGEIPDMTWVWFLKWLFEMSVPIKKMPHPNKKTLFDM